VSPNEWLAIGMVVAFFGLLVVGIPVAMAIATSALVFGYLGFGPMLFNLLPARIYGVATNYALMAIRYLSSWASPCRSRSSLRSCWTSSAMPSAG
jgi:TRAP-type mannitol/chloroaromatic compound transport system permease large subunit